MVSPATYYGYDKDNNCIVKGTAEDATNYLNPNEVKAAIEKLKQTFSEQMQSIARSLTKISEDSAQALVIQGTKMSGTIDDTTEIIMQLPEQLLSGIDDIYDASVTAKDKIQQDLNTKLYNQIVSYSGVVRVNG